MSTIPINHEETFSQVLDRERVEDAREELDGALPSILSDLEHVIHRLVLAHGYACDINPLAALFLSEIIKKSGKVKRDLGMLVAVREGTREL